MRPSLASQSQIIKSLRGTLARREKRYRALGATGMPDDNQKDDNNRLKVDMAELKGTILTEIRHMGHDIKNIMQAMTLFMPRAEIDANNKRFEEKAAQSEVELKRRLERLENHLTWLWQTIGAAWIGGLITWVAFWPKK